MSFTHLVPYTDHQPTGLLSIMIAFVALMMILFVALHGYMPYGTWRVALEITDDMLATRREEKSEES